MKELTNSQAIIAVVLILWAIVIGYYLVNIFKGMKPVSKIEFPDKKVLNSIEVNDEENLSTEHKSFLNVVQNSTFDDEDVSLNYESTKFLMRVKYYGQENYILEYSKDDKLYLPLNELFDLSETMHEIWVVQQPILFKQKQEAIEFSNKFIEYDDCERHNKNVNDEYEALLEYRKQNPPKPKPNKEIDKTTLIIEK